MATADLLVDTDVLVDHLRGTHRLRADGRTLGVSVVSLCELFAGRGADDRLRRFLAPFVDLTVDGVVAELAGMIRREAGIATPDALIAATALTHDIPLMTRNRRHFDQVGKLRVVGPGGA